MKSISIVIVMFMTLTVGANTGFCISTDNCTVAFFQNVVGPGVMITSAQIKTTYDPPPPASSVPLPEHCRVEGWRSPDDGFIVKLSSAWNGRLYQVGNGGAAGTIGEPAMTFGLQRGFVTAGGSGGHRAPATMFQFGFPPNDPKAQRKIEDYCYGSAHETNVLARKVIKAYYGNDLVRAYFIGYSTGGRQGFMEAQRYPQDFDGILAGGNPFPFTVRTMSDTWEATQLLGAGYISTTKLPILADAVMAKCDAIDGLVDGFIDDPRKCTFNALTDLPACPGDVDGPNCITAAQSQAVYNIYDGPRKSDGTLLARGVSFGSEAIMADGKSGWTMFVPTEPGGKTFALGLGSSFVQWVGLPPEKGGPGRDWKTFDVNTDWDIVSKKWGAECDTYNPNLWPFKLRGGKLIHYHGWADALCWAAPTPDYYDQVVKWIGSEKETRKFYRLYMIPGMTHFPGARGVLDRNTLIEPFFMALVDWVEHGIEPGAFVGSRPTAAGRWTAITRPVCPYPEAARYLGTGSIDDAKNFTCVKLTPTKVRIEPKTVNLGSKGTFTAFLTFPGDYDVKNFKAVTCGGAAAVKGTFTKEDYCYEAKFNSQDLINISAGEAVTFTVTAIFEHDGQKVAFEGSDTIRVVK